jgi:hypothetical protein
MSLERGQNMMNAPTLPIAPVRGKSCALCAAILALAAALAACAGSADAPEAQGVTAEDLAQRFVEEQIGMYAGSAHGETAITDSRITRLERADVFYDMLAYPVELWRLEYRLKPDDLSKLPLAGGMNEEDGWLTEDTSMGKPVLVLSYEDAAPQYMGCIWDGERDLTTPAGRETALRIFLENLSLLPRESFGGDHALVKFPLSTGESCQLLLSQPAAQGDAGIWCAERWMDGNGYVYHITPQTTTDRAAAYYAALQAQCDEGHRADLLDPMQTALAYVTEELGQPVTRADLTLVRDARAADFYETPVSDYIGYISYFNTDDLYFHLDRIEWLTAETDAERLRALGIEPESLPNGFYIHNPASYPDWFQVSEQTRYEILDPGGAAHRDVGLAEFAAHLAQFSEFAPPFRVSAKDGFVRRIVEQYVP